jgi:hypothetical protein
VPDGAEAGPVRTSGPRTADSWRVRICDRAGHTHGAGVLVDADLVLTAASVPADHHPVLHIAPTAAVRREHGGERRISAVRVPPAAAGNSTQFALLRLNERAVASPARLAPCRAPANRPVSLYGYPRGLTGGVWARARVCDGPSPTGCVPLAADTEPSTRIGRGFRGAGVLDPRSGAVIGIVVADDAAAGTYRAWMRPIEAAADPYPALAGLITAPRPLRRGWLYELLEVLLAVPAVADPASRDQIVRLLRPDIAAAVPRHPAARFDVWAVLRTCLLYPDGLPELVEVIRVFEGDSIPMLQLSRAAAQLPDGPSTP